MVLIGITKEPETIIDAFSIFITNRKGIIVKDGVRNFLRKYAPGLKGKDIEEILEKSNVILKLGYMIVIILLIILIVYFLLNKNYWKYL